MQYPVEDFTPEERARLAPHVTNLDQPVFALVNLPETVKGALFARYSRYQGTLRRLFLDEFADSLPEAAAAFDGERGQARGRALRAHLRRLRGRLGGAARRRARRRGVVLERPHEDPPAPAARAPTSSRPRATSPTTRRWRATRLPLLPRPASSARSTRRRWTTCSARTRPRSPRWRGWVDATFPRADGESEAARRRAINAKALDLLRGLLPAVVAVAHGHLRDRARPTSS